MSRNRDIELLMIRLLAIFAVTIVCGAARLDNAPVKGGHVYITERDSCDYVERNEGFVQIVCTEVTHVR